MREPFVAFDDGHTAAKPAHGLCEFKADVTAADDQDMFGNDVQFECFYMCERISFSETGNGFNRRPRTRADDDLFSAKRPFAAIRRYEFDGLGTGKTPGSDEQLRPARLEVGEVHVHQTVHHSALADAHGGHVDFAIVLADAEFLAAEKIGGNLGAVNDIFAWEACDVGTGTANIFSLNHGHPLALFGQSPGDVFSPFAAAQHQHIVSFRVLDLIIHK